MSHALHCACQQLLLASVTPLDKLPRRKTDRAVVVPLPDAPARLSSATGETHYARLAQPLEEYVFTPIAGATTAPEVVIALEDGYEKRHLLRCGRCFLTWGYMLSWASFSDSASRTGRREDVVYVFDSQI
ncbi:hypothetical protein ANO11243_063260 [Dothideomycetidae sp. 11243]|nr:hypothetical protein ANO11243_063260 [fungal sp. No.11243]